MTSSAVGTQSNSSVLDTVGDMAASLKQDEVEVELRSPDRRRKVAIVDKNGLTSMEIQEYLDVFEVLLDSKHLKCYCVCMFVRGGVVDKCI